MHALVGVDVGASPKRHVLHQGQHVQGERCQIFGDGFHLTFGTTSSVWLLPGHGRRRRVSRHGARLVPLLAGAHQIDAGLLQLVPRIVEVALDADVQRLLGEEGGDGAGVDGTDDLRHRRAGRNGLRHDANAPFALAARVQQGALHGDHGRRDVRLVVHEIESEHGVGRAVGQRQQVRPAHEEVAVEVADAHAPGAADAHHGLEGGVERQRPSQLALEAGPVRLVAEARVGVQGPRGDLAELRQAGRVDVGAGEEEHVDADLRPRELHGRVLVPGRAGAEQLDLVVGAHQAHVLARDERAVPQRGQDALEDAHLPADVLGHREGGLERGAEARAFGGGLLEHAGQAVEKGVDDVPALLQVDQQVVGGGDEELREVRHDQHLRTAQAALEVVVVDAVVEGEEAHLRARGPGQGIQRLGNGPGDALEHAAPDAGHGHVDDEEVAGGLGRADHVLGGRHVLHHRLREFRAGVLVAAATLLVEMAVVRRGDLVQLGADVAAPPPSIFHKGDEGVHVGAAPAQQRGGGRHGRGRSERVGRAPATAPIIYLT